MWGVSRRAKNHERMLRETAVASAAVSQAGVMTSSLDHLRISELWPGPRCQLDSSFRQSPPPYLGISSALERLQDFLAVLSGADIVEDMADLTTCIDHKRGSLHAGDLPAEDALHPPDPVRSGQLGAFIGEQREGQVVFLPEALV